MIGLRMRSAAALIAMTIVLPAAPAGAAVQVERVESPGGLIAWLVRDDSVPVISMSFAFRGGAALDPAGKEGRASMVSGLLDEGAGSLDSAAYQERLRDNAIRLGFDASRDSFDGQLRTIRENRVLAFEMLGMALTAPRFEVDAVERIRSQIITGLERAKTDPGTMARRGWMRAVFGDHPYGRQTGGTLESVPGLSIADFRGFVAERLARDALVIGVAGDISAAELAPLLDVAFAGLPAKAAPASLPRPQLMLTGQTLVLDLAVPQSTVVFGQAGPKRRDPDYYAATVLNHILGGGSFTSRLTEEVREKRGLAYSIYSYLSPFEQTGLLMGSAGTQNARVAETLSVIRAEWRRMAEQGPTLREVTEAKSNLTGAFPLRFTSTGRVARMLVGMQWFDLGMDYIDRRNSLIDAVTLDDVRRVARKWLAPDRLAVVIAGQPEGIDPAAPARN
jgi:zinc protease